MRKLTLTLDALQVETFQVTARPDESRGTVRGHDDTYAVSPCNYTGDGCTNFDCSGYCNSNGCASMQTCPGGGIGCPPAMDDPAS